MEYEQDATWREGWWLGKRYKRGRSGRSCPSPTSSWRRAPPGWSSGTAPPGESNIGLREVLILVSTFMVAISRSCSCFSWSMWKLACTCWISSTSFTCKSMLVLMRKVNKIGELVFTAGQTTQLDNLMLVQRAACVCCRSTERDESSSYEIEQNKGAHDFPAWRP